MKVMFQMMNEARIGVGLQSLSSASIAYLHALKYAKERLQGSSLMEMKNPEAPRVPIIQHPDVRRMLLWMKAHTDGFRALLYFCALCGDRIRAAADEAEQEKWNGFLEVLTPICKAYCSDMGFRVTETAIQIYGGYGYCSEYPVEQFLRDEKICSIYEGANGIQALDLVGRKLGLKKGLYFMNLLGEMGATIAKYQAALPDLAPDVQAAMNTLAEVAMLFAANGKAGKFMIPVANATPFLMLMGQVVMAWMLLWQAGVAKEKLAAPDGGRRSGLLRGEGRHGPVLHQARPARGGCGGQGDQKRGPLHDGDRRRGLRLLKKQIHRRDDSRSSTQAMFSRIRSGMGSP